jgi:hypothetical protein
VPDRLCDFSDVAQPRNSLPNTTTYTRNRITGTSRSMVPREDADIAQRLVSDRGWSDLRVGPNQPAGAKAAPSTFLVGLRAAGRLLLGGLHMLRHERLRRFPGRGEVPSALGDAGALHHCSSPPSGPSGVGSPTNSKWTASTSSERNRTASSKSLTDPSSSTSNEPSRVRRAT